MYPRVAFQGVKGAFSERAIGEYWPHGATPVPAATFSDALQLVTSGTARFAAIPVENVIAGPVRAALAALADTPSLRVIDELRVDIHLCLVAKPGVECSMLREVYSHPMALAQSGRFFQEHPWLSAQEYADTAAAAQHVAQQLDKTVAAIASESAATQYGLSIIARNIQDRPDNWTRFVIVCRK